MNDPVRGTVAQYTASTSVLQIGTAGLELGQLWTASAWFKGLINDANLNTLFRSLSGDSAVSVNLSSNDLGYRSSAGVFADTSFDMVPANFSTDWHQISVVRSPNLLDFYLDGVHVGEAIAGAGGSSSVNFSTNIQSIGNQPAGGARFASFLDDVVLYNQSLTADQVAQLFREPPTLRANINSDAFIVTGTNKNDHLSHLTAIGDFNGDKRTDYVVSDQNRSYLLFGPVALADEQAIDEVADIVIDHSAVGRPATRFADIDNDGLSDLAFIRSDSSFHIVTVVYGNEIGGLSAASMSPGRATGTVHSPVLF